MFTQQFVNELENCQSIIFNSPIGVNVTLANALVDKVLNDVCSRKHCQLKCQMKFTSCLIYCRRTVVATCTELEEFAPLVSCTLPNYQRCVSCLVFLRLTIMFRAVLTEKIVEYCQNIYTCTRGLTRLVDLPLPLITADFLQSPLSSNISPLRFIGSTISSLYNFQSVLPKSVYPIILFIQFYLFVYHLCSYDTRLSSV